MENINLDLLFPQSSSKTLDVNNLYGDRFTTDELIKTKEDRKQKIKKCYDNVLKNCYKSIKYENSIGKTDLIFNVPPVMVQNIYYDQNRCQMFIEKRLKRLKLDFLRLDNNRLFITWISI